MMHEYPRGGIKVEEERDMPFTVVKFKSLEEVCDCVKQYQEETCTHFIKYNRDKHFGDEEYVPNIERGRIHYWSNTGKYGVPIEYDGVPFMHVGRWVLMCHQGQDINKGHKQKYQMRKLREHLESGVKPRTRNRTQVTKKVNCPAEIYITHVMKFPQHKMPSALLEINSLPTDHMRKAAKRKIVSSFKRHSSRFVRESWYFVRLPDPSVHDGHPVFGLVKEELELNLPEHCTIELASHHLSSTHIKTTQERTNTTQEPSPPPSPPSPPPQPDIPEPTYTREQITSTTRPPEPPPSPPLPPTTKPHQELTKKRRRTVKTPKYRTKEPVDPRVLQKMYELTRQGVTTVKMMQRAIEEFVSEELFPYSEPPPSMYRRYNPTPSDIQNAMYKVKQEMRLEGKSIVQYRCAALVREITELVVQTDNEEYLSKLEEQLRSIYNSVKISLPVPEMKLWSENGEGRKRRASAEERESEMAGISAVDQHQRAKRGRSSSSRHSNNSSSRQTDQQQQQQQTETNTAAYHLSLENQANREREDFSLLDHHHLQQQQQPKVHEIIQQDDGTIMEVYYYEPEEGEGEEDDPPPPPTTTTTTTTFDATAPQPTHNHNHSNQDTIIIQPENLKTEPLEICL